MGAVHAFLPWCSRRRGTMLLVIEDLSGAEWPPPWSSRRIDAVLASLDEVHAARPPAGIEFLQAEWENVVGWGVIAADPEPLPATKLCSLAWLEEALPALLRERSSGALWRRTPSLRRAKRQPCFVDRRAILVDWNLACVGNGRFDIAFWLPSLRLEGGSKPQEVLPDAGTLAAAVAGFFAARAGLVAPQGAPIVRAFQRAQAAVALPWAARELGLAPPY
jgi:hypothetical protein